MPALSRQRLAIALIFISPALWSVNYMVARSAPGVIEPHALALLRWLMASMLFALGARSELWAQRHQIATDWKHYLVLGALGMWICGAWVYIGGRTTGAVNIALIYSMSPVLIAAFSALWLRERFSPWQAGGVALAFTGVLHVVLKGQWAALAAVQFVPGDGWILAATLSWTAYSLLLKKWPSPLGASARLAVISFTGVLVLLPFAIWEAWHNPLPVLTLPGFGLALAVAVLPGYGSYLAYSVMQRELGAARVSAMLYLGPLYAAVLAWLVLGEPLQSYHAWGMALVLPGIYLVTRQYPAARPQSSSR
jgi:drug/metabolite transporter (DMT)-like permease